MARPHSCLRWRRWELLALGLGGLVGVGAQSPPPTQAQVAWRFLGEVLRADYAAAYPRLAPEVRASLRPAAFARATQQLRQLGQRRGAHIELYSVGTQLSERREQWFYRFSFASDSLHRPPPVLLEVTFRDTTSRQVLGFGVRAR